MASSFCCSSGIAALGASTSSRFNCECGSFTGRFTHYLPRRLFLGSLIPIVRSLPSTQHVAQFAHCFSTDQRRTNRELCAFGIKHPRGKCTNSPVGKLAEKLLAVAVLHPSPYAQGLAVERMPTVKHRCELRMMCIMFRDRPALVEVT